MTAHRCEVVLFEDPESDIRCGARSVLYVDEWRDRTDVNVCTEHAIEATADGAELHTIDPTERFS